MYIFLCQNPFDKKQQKQLHMKNQLVLFVSSLMLLFASCNVNPDNGTDADVVVVEGDITASTTWSASKIYLLKRNVFVTNNAVLTIEPGTLIKGDKATKGSLVITRGAKIMAAGTTEKPIVFTSNIAAGGRSQGDWGGIILLGKAPNNLGTAVAIEGVSDATDKAKHGGTDANDNSGVMQYVRIEYAGIPLGPDNEINALTFGSVGAGTTIDHIQVYRSGDDAFEWFGGTVNVKYLLAINTWDDDFDVDNGFSGKVQFALAQRLASTADVSGSNGFEADNNSKGTNDEPQTSAVFSNVTILGPVDKAGAKNINANFQHAAQIRRNASISIFNSIFAGYTEGVYFDDALPAGGTANASANLLSGKSVVANNLVVGCNGKATQIKTSNAGVLATVSALLTGELSSNSFAADKYASALITDPYKYSSDLASASSGNVGVPVFTALPGSEAASGAKFSDAKLASGFDNTTTFRGAFGATNWANGWAHFDPQTLPYDKPGVVK